MHCKYIYSREEKKESAYEKKKKKSEAASVTKTQIKNASTLVFFCFSFLLLTLSFFYSPLSSLLLSQFKQIAKVFLIIKMAYLLYSFRRS